MWRMIHDLRIQVSPCRCSKNQIFEPTPNPSNEWELRALEILLRKHNLRNSPFSEDQKQLHRPLPADSSTCGDDDIATCGLSQWSRVSKRRLVCGAEETFSRNGCHESPSNNARHEQTLICKRAFGLQYASCSNSRDCLDFDFRVLTRSLRIVIQDGVDQYSPGIQLRASE